MKSVTARSRHVSSSLRLVLIALLGLVLSGCTMRAIIGVDVNPDESGSFQMTVSYDEEMRQLLEQETDQPIDWSDPSTYGEDSSPIDMDEFPPGASIEPYSDGEFQGFSVTFDFDSLDQLNAFLAETGEGGEDALPFRVTSDGDGNFELVTDGDLFGTAGLSEEDTEMIPPEMLSDLFDMQLHLSLPGKVIETNADETSGDGTMVWHLNPMATDSVAPAASSQVTGSGSALVWIVVLVVVVVAVAGAVLFIRGRTEGDSEPTVEAPEEEPVS